MLISFFLQDKFCAAIQIDAWTTSAFADTIVRQDALVSLLEKANKGDVIMISNIDRAFRNVEVAEEALRDCEARGISVVVTDFFKDDHSVYQLIVDGESNVIFPEGSPLPATKAREMVLEFLKSSAWEKSKQQGVYTSMQAYMENFLDNTELRAACKPVFDAILGGNNVVICPRVSTVSLNFFISFI